MRIHADPDPCGSGSTALVLEYTGIYTTEKRRHNLTKQTWFGWIQMDLGGPVLEDIYTIEKRRHNLPE